MTTFRPSPENVSPTVYSVLAGFAATLIDSTVAGFGFSARAFCAAVRFQCGGHFVDGCVLVDGDLLGGGLTVELHVCGGGFTLGDGRRERGGLQRRLGVGADEHHIVDVAVGVIDEAHVGEAQPQSAFRRGVGGHGERGGHVLRLTAFVSAVVDAVASSSVYCAHAEPVPLPALRLFTVAVATWDQKTREGMILLVNRDEHNAHDVTIDLTSLPRLGERPSVTSSQMLPSDDIYRTNTADEPDGVTLQPLSAALDEGRMTVSLPPVTWASVRFTA